MDDHLVTTALRHEVVAAPARGLIAVRHRGGQVLVDQGRRPAAPASAVAADGGGLQREVAAVDARAGASVQLAITLAPRR